RHLRPPPLAPWRRVPHRARLLPRRMGLAPLERPPMNLRLARLIILLGLVPCAASLFAANGDALIIVGAPGEDAYAEAFARAAEEWTDAAEQGGVTATVVGLEPADETEDIPADRDRIKSWLESADPASTELLWFVFIGHGSYDGRTAKLNLHGPDIAAPELAEWLRPLQRPMVIVHG